MELELQKENEDGSVDYIVNLSAEETAQIVRYGMLDMLKRLVEEGKKYDPNTPTSSLGGGDS